MPTSKSRGLEQEGFDAQVDASGILQVAGNERCNDCGVRGPDWVSTGFGVLLCLDCSGMHRSFGTHITSRVRSLKLDKWEDAASLAELHLLANGGGNASFKEYVTGLQLPYPFRAASTDPPVSARTVAEIYASPGMAYYKDMLQARATGRLPVSWELFTEQQQRQEDVANRARADSAISDTSINGAGGRSESKDRGSGLGSPYGSGKNTAAHRAMGQVAATPECNVAHWIPDRICNKCMLCDSSFHIFLRKHHCRKCGACVCAECAPSANTKPILELGLTDAVRHCKSCYRSPMIHWTVEEG